MGIGGVIVVVHVHVLFDIIIGVECEQPKRIVHLMLATLLYSITLISLQFKLFNFRQAFVKASSFCKSFGKTLCWLSPAFNDLYVYLAEIVTKSVVILAQHFAFQKAWQNKG